MEDTSITRSMKRDFSPSRFPPSQAKNDESKITQVFYKNQPGSPDQAMGKKSRGHTPDHSPEPGLYKTSHSTPGSSGKRSLDHTPDQSPDVEASISSRSVQGSAEKKARQESLLSPDRPNTRSKAQEETPGTQTAGLFSALNMRSPGLNVPMMSLSESSNSSSAETQTKQEFSHHIRPNRSFMEEDEYLDTKTVGLSSSFYDKLPDADDSMMLTSESSTSRSATSNPFASLSHLPREVPEEIQSALQNLTRSEHLTLPQMDTLLDTLGILIFKHRKLNPETNPIELYAPNTLFKLCDLFTRAYPTNDSTASRLVHRNLIATIKTALGIMTTQQKEQLLNLLGTDTFGNNPCYAPISAACFEKFFIEIDPRLHHALRTLPSHETTLRNVIHRAQTDINQAAASPANIALCEKVKELAVKFLTPTASRKFPLNYYFHTTTPDRLPHFKQNGIPVSHEKLYPGAFTSSAFENSFGIVGVAVPTNRLAAMQQDLTRIERRPTEDGGHIWLGSQKPLIIDPDITIYSSDISEEALTALQNEPSSSDRLLIPSDVLAKFLSYSRQDHWYSPVPSRTSQRDVKAHSRGKQS